MKYDAFVAHKRILLIIPPILLALGSFGNICAFLVLWKNIRKVSTYTYLCALAVVDLIVLITGLLRLWVGQFVTDVLDSHEIICKAGIFLGYLSSDISVWLIVIVTIERFIVVIFPLKSLRLCNLKVARISIALVVVVFVSVNIHFLWSVKLQEYHYNNVTISKCQAQRQFQYLVEDIWPWVDAGIYSFVPFFSIIVLNCFIIRKILLARKTRNVLSQHTSLSKGNNETEMGKKSGEMSVKITIMLLSVSFTFLITTLPMNLVLIHSSVSGKSGSEEDVSFAKQQLMGTLAEMLMYVNHSINFFLYCTTGKKFRGQFQSLLCCCGTHGFVRRMRGQSQRLSSSFQFSTNQTKTISFATEQSQC